MAKANRNQKRSDKLTDEKAKILKREAMLLELKSYSISKSAQGRLSSVVTSNNKNKKTKLPFTVNS